MKETALTIDWSDEFMVDLVYELILVGFVDYREIVDELNLVSLVVPHLHGVYPLELYRPHLCLLIGNPRFG